MSYTIAELHGDGIAEELSTAIHTIARDLRIDMQFVNVDLSESARQERGDAAVYEEAEAQMRRCRTALKYPTATTTTSPNRELRERCNFAVIHRPVRTIAGIETNFKAQLDVDIVRVATGGTYEDMGRRIGHDTAVSLRVIERVPSRRAGRFAFKLAQLRGCGVVSTSKYTIQKETDGLFEEVVQRVSRDYPATPYRQELFDALLAGIIMRPERYGVIVCPNEYGDFLSDAAMGLVGSIGLGDSASYAFDEHGQVTLAMFDPSGGTAPDIAGQDICNPTATIFAFANMLRHLGDASRGEALRAGVRACIAAGE
ncbi:MAG: isocitrate/isopropylmalate family dehydrogenase, partial [Nannocystaceae bacterium]